MDKKHAAHSADTSHVTSEGGNATPTLQTFSERTGCHFTTASRLRSGERLPGRRLLGRIVREYHLEPDQALEAYTQGREHFGDFLRQRVFNETDAHPSSSQEVPSGDASTAHNG